jgi:hypothetical protein
MQSPDWPRYSPRRRAAPKLRHAVALTLAGWYLMLPPLFSRRPLIFETRAPLSRWYFASVFATASQCEEGRAERNRRWIKATIRENHPSSAEILGLKEWQAQEKCVSADDPRLEGHGIVFDTPIPIKIRRKSN